LSIIFKTVRWKNLLSTGNIFTEVQLNANDSTLIVGENGAGKSTFIEAVFYAMFGRSFRKINKPQLINTINQKNMLVELEFSIGSKEYMIRRGMKPNVFEIFQDDKLVNQDAAARDYQEYLEKQIFKMNHKSASQIIVLGSSNYTPFMQLPAQHRREVIEDLLDLQIFSVMNTLLKQKVIDNKNDLREIKYKADLIQEKIRLQNEYINSVQANNQKQIDTNKLKLVEIDTEISEIDAAIKSLEAQIVDQLNGVDLNAEFQALVKKLNNTNSLQKSFEDKVAKIQKDILFYDSNDNCPTCKQGISHVFKCETINKKNEQIDEAAASIDELIEKKKDLYFKMEGINSLQEIVNQLQQKINEHGSKLVTLVSFRKKIEQEITRLSEEHVTNVEDHEKLADLKKQLGACADEHEKLIAQRSILDITSILLKDGGIKSKIIKQYIPVMNKLINKYLAAMELTVSFELDENFNETVRSRHRDEFSYDSFSEGEKARIDLAILFAWRAISKLRNANACNLLILDETFDGSLDATGTEELMKIISSVLSDSNVFVISHKGDSLVDKFSNILRFEKVKNYSRIKDVV
jgi:DNA repair exonuclease SbcCD ATPase subunit